MNMDSAEADASKDSNAVVDSSGDSVPTPDEGNEAPSTSSTEVVTSGDADQPPAVDMKEVDEAIVDASVEDSAPVQLASPGEPVGDAPSPALSSPVSAPTPPQLASPPVSPQPPPPPPVPLYDLPLMISTAVSSSDFSAFLLRLEEIELEAPDGVPPPDVYCCMIIANLIVSDIVNAKLLWKRIPSLVKSENPEFESLWQIATKLWASDFKVVFAELGQREWSPLIQPLLACLAKSVRHRVITLIEKSYESLRLSSMSNLLGLADEDAQLALASERDWPVAQGFARPSKRLSPESTRRVQRDEDALQRLTDYVAFLEE